MKMSALFLSFVKLIKVFKMTKLRYLLFVTLVFMALSAEGKKFPFDINSTPNISVHRSTIAGTKMVKVTAYGSSANSAIDKAMLDAVVGITFFGANGSGEMESCPAILYDGKDCYYQNKKFFDNFFKKGQFLDFVEKVNSGYPLGENNVKTPHGRRIQILLIVHWDALADFFKKNGFKTIVSELSNY